MENNLLTPPEEGSVILIDKDLDWTSFNVVKKVKNVLLNKFGIKKLKVGHAGTLDPLATGLVIICTGKMTKSIEKYQAAEKEYLATIKLGATTPSFDLETEIDKEYSCEHITREDVIKVLEGFIGTQDQLPPVFSAKNIKGKRAYEYARKGIEVEMKLNKITIFELELVTFNLPELKLRIVCSKGTYIRALARDIGEKLGSGAHLTALRRTRIGKYKVEESFNINDYESSLSNNI
ncbi:MAG: tRNA pseudouridine(55) synthase TruB [Bacteroidales bacterium]|nr:tRNA pseudouridine(55) synthase TruB [Bacteroidales bacterium]MCF8391317.1 tRNA pseudouridine(55) synthase TruB [Bacteroidales bacterium]